MESSESISSERPSAEVRGRRGSPFRAALDRIGRWFPENRFPEPITTALPFDVPADRIWGALRFYEEIPTPPPVLLRLLMPTPIRSTGQKNQPGASIVCTYEGGHLVKRITSVDAPRLLRFEVVEQDLGIENCISLAEGSYEIRDRGRGCELLLTTTYRGRLRPRWLWRPLERALAHAVHRHILRGIRDL